MVQTQIHPSKCFLNRFCCNSLYKIINNKIIKIFKSFFILVLFYIVAWEMCLHPTSQFLNVPWGGYWAQNCSMFKITNTNIPLSEYNPLSCQFVHSYDTINLFLNLKRLQFIECPEFSLLKASHFFILLFI